MSVYKNLKVIGSSHIAKESVKKINEAYDELNPEHIAIELDIGRYRGMMSNAKDSLNPKMILEVGLFGYLFALFGKVTQSRMGRIINTTPGIDMKTAINLARKNKKKLHLIDQPIKKTLKNLSKGTNILEILKILFEPIVTLIAYPFIHKKLKKQYKGMNFSLNKIPDEKTINLILSTFKKKYPSIYKTLIGDRNHYMAKKLVVLMKKNPNVPIIAVVGAGHKKEMIELIKKYEKTIEIV